MLKMSAEQSQFLSMFACRELIDQYKECGWPISLDLLDWLQTYALNRGTRESWHQLKKNNPHADTTHVLSEFISFRADGDRVR